MPRSFRPLVVSLLLPLLPCALAPAIAASFRVEVVNTKREPSGRIWGAGPWIAFCVDETEQTLNGDMDTDDTVLHLFNSRTLATVSTGIAVDSTLVDSDEDWPVDFFGDMLAVQVSELDNGQKDLNGNGRAEDNVLHLYNTASRQLTSVGVIAAQPTLLERRLYFVQAERDAGKDLNGDRDMADSVLCVYDLTTRQTESLGMEAENGFQVVGDRVAAIVSEAAQGGADLNGDKDTQDLVLQLYSTAEKKWVNTGLECSYGFELTPKLAAVGVEEQKQGARDLNGDGDTKDIVAHVWDLAAGKAINLGQDCTGDLVADGSFVAFNTVEKAQGNADLNGDKDTQDEVAQYYALGAQKPLNLGRDASGGITTAGGKIAFACSEADQGNKDLNGDRDTNDFVLLVYDPAANKVFNSLHSVDGDLETGGNYLAWTVLEADQANRDLNRDGDVDDSIVFVMELTGHSIYSTGTCSADYLCLTGQAVAFSTPEEEQGRRDLNMDRDTEDSVLQVGRIIPGTK
jgi:hypothetical protein